MVINESDIFTTTFTNLPEISKTEFSNITLAKIITGK